MIKTMLSNNNRGRLQRRNNGETPCSTVVCVTTKQKLWHAALVVIIGGLLFFAGCSGTINTRKTGVASKKYSKWNVHKKQSPVYHSFKDVLIPGELKINKQKTSLHKAGGFTAGVMTLYGMTPAKKLQSFFEKNMITDNWRKMSSCVSFRTMLLYQKQNRSCIIYIYESDFKKIVEIWVAPLTSLSVTHAGR